MKLGLGGQPQYQTEGPSILLYFRLSQCVRGERVVGLDRRANKILDEAGVLTKFGVPPLAIPDYLALVGDSADGFPGLPGWGAKTSAAVLAKYGHLERIPTDTPWQLPVRGEDRLVGALRDNFNLALLFRDLATLRTEAPVLTSPEDLRWNGATESFAEICQQLEAPAFRARAARIRTR